MGGGGSAPAPSAEERDLQAQQAELLKMQSGMLSENQRVQELLQPLFLEEAGLTAIYGDNPRKPAIESELAALRSQRDAAANSPAGRGIGNAKRVADLDFKINRLETELGNTKGQSITGYERLNRPEDTLRQEIELMSLERAKAALAGELPVDPALMKDLDERYATLEEELTKDFGSIAAARTSTPGSARLRDFDIYKENVTSAARRGDLTLAQQLASNQGADNLNRLINVPSTVASMPFNTSGFNQLNQSLSQTLGGYQNERFAQMQANSADTQGLYTLAGAGLTAGAYYF